MLPPLPAELWEVHILPTGGPLALARSVGACPHCVAAVRVQRRWRARVPWEVWMRKGLPVDVYTRAASRWRRGHVSEAHGYAGYWMIKVYDAGVKGGGYLLFVLPGAVWVVPRRRLAHQLSRG